MSGLLKVLLWTTLAAVVAVAAAIGFGFYRFSTMFPDAEEGRALADQLTTELGHDHPAFTVTSDSEVSSAEVSLTLTPVNGALSEPEIAGVLADLEVLAAEHEDSPWSVTSTIRGTWGTTELEIQGTAADRWPALAPVLQVAGGSRTEIALYLDDDRAVIARDLDTERLCGEGTHPNDFFTSGLHEASTALTELEWTAPDSPGLLFLARGCEPQLRLSLALEGEQRLERAQDLEALIDSLTADQVLTGITLDQTGELDLGLRGTTGLPPADLRELWPHSEVWVDGARVTAP